MTPRKRLSDIISNHADLDKVRKDWATKEAAPELTPLPPDWYICRILSGELFTSKNKKPGYKLTLEITEGEHQGRKLWWDTWLTAAALPLAKRDLLKIGVTDLEQLEGPAPSGILLRVKVAKRVGEDGATEFNHVSRF